MGEGHEYGNESLASKQGTWLPNQPRDYRLLKCILVSRLSHEQVIMSLNVSSSYLLIYKTKMYNSCWVVLYHYKTWPISLRAEHKLST